LCLPLGTAHAERVERADLAEARGMVERQEFDEALDALDQVLQTGELGPAEVAAVYRLIAECTAALRRPDEARDAFVLLLVVDPEFYVSSSESPLIREPFEQALAAWEERPRPELDYQPPAGIAEDEPFVVAPTLRFDSAPLLFSTVSLHVRAEGARRYRAMDLEGGQVQIPPSRFEDATALEIYFTVHDEHGNTVAFVGEPGAPLRVPVGEPVSGDGEGRRLHQRWWFWTIIGAAVVGLAVGLSVGLGTADDRESPCVRNFGSECDLNVHLDL
jgi:hypothetical protein